MSIPITRRPRVEIHSSIRNRTRKGFVKWTSASHPRLFEVLGVVIKRFEKMMQGTEGRWRQSRRRSKHEVLTPFYQILKPNPTVVNVPKANLTGNSNHLLVFVICLHINPGFWQWRARFSLLCLHLYLHLLPCWCCPLCSRCKYSSVSDNLKSCNGVQGKPLGALENGTAY